MTGVQTCALPILLLDVLLTDGDTVRSLAIGCDPDPVWFDEFDPLGEPAA